MHPDEADNGDVRSVWDSLLWSMTEIGRASKYQTIKEPLALLGLSYVRRRDEVEVALSDPASKPSRIALELVETIEKHSCLEGQPFSKHLLSDLAQVEPTVISRWLAYGAEDWPLVGFCDWYTAKLDELGFDGHHDTPSSVSQLVASLFADRSFQSVSDPACGTGGLLAAAAEHIRGEKLIGQEMSSEAWAWANMRFLVCGLNDIALTMGNALADQSFLRLASERGCDLVLTNPPFGMHLDSQTVSLLSQHTKDLIGLPTGRPHSETAFVQEIFLSLSESGAAAVIVPNGFLFRGGIDQRLRKALIRSDAVQAIIGLPARLFAPRTTIEASIVVLNRAKSDIRSKGHVLFLDARRLGRREGVRVLLDDEAIRGITIAFSEWKTERGFSEIVELEKLEAEDFSLSPAHYVEPASPSVTVKPIDRRSNIIELDERYATLHQEYEALRSRLARS